MSARLLKFVVFFAGLAVLAFVVEQQRETTATLREKAERLRAAGLAHMRLREEHATLQAQNVSPDELAQLRADHAERARLRAEAAALRGKREAVPPPQTAEVPTAPTPPPSVELWTNAGRATPNDTFQTGVWASVHGDTDTLAKVITFDAEGRALIDAQFARLPEKDRSLYGSPEKVFATLLAVRLPQDLTSATVTQTTEGSESTVLRMRLQRANGSSKESNFNFIRTAGDDGWRILVPTNVVKNYQLMLTDPTVLHIQ
jgi:hypothetical protein